MLNAVIVFLSVAMFCAIVLLGLFAITSIMFPPIDYTDVLDGDLLGEEEER